LPIKSIRTFSDISEEPPDYKMTLCVIDGGALIRFEGQVDLSQTAPSNQKRARVASSCGSTSP